jgi:hypothetical protein
MCIKIKNIPVDVCHLYGGEEVRQRSGLPAVSMVELNVSHSVQTKTTTFVTVVFFRIFICVLQY